MCTNNVSPTWYTTVALNGKDVSRLPPRALDFTEASRVRRGQSGIGHLLYLVERGPGGGVSAAGSRGVVRAGHVLGPLRAGEDRPRHSPVAGLLPRALQDDGGRRGRHAGQASGSRHGSFLSWARPAAS